MNKIRLLSFLVIVLAILNITLLVVFVNNKPNHPPHPKFGKEPKNIIIERLHFDDAQVDAYDKLIQEHRLKIETLDTKLREAKEELYILLNEDDSSQTKTYFSKIAKVQKDIEKLHFNHFIDIKKLCKENQLQYYDELTHELARIFSPHPSPR